MGKNEMQGDPTLFIDYFARLVGRLLQRNFLVSNEKCTESLELLYKSFNHN